ncbi:unnamed protein product [Prorocentrum cordatum]|uniref:Uncharacterized protein n=1 Tax=Prorocentrum cordatum TaxID=2364126 RepID=A0ABN9TP68_9DINO|nr:unnamed protein product [Polarella glacialis]
MLAELQQRADKEEAEKQSLAKEVEQLEASAAAVEKDTKAAAQEALDMQAKIELAESETESFKAALVSVSETVSAAVYGPESDPIQLLKVAVTDIAASEEKAAQLLRKKQEASRRAEALGKKLEEVARARGRLEAARERAKRLSAGIDAIATGVGVGGGNLFSIFSDPLHCSNVCILSSARTFEEHPRPSGEKKRARHRKKAQGMDVRAMARTRRMRGRSTPSWRRVQGPCRRSAPCSLRRRGPLWTLAAVLGRGACGGAPAVRGAGRARARPAPTAARTRRSLRPMWDPGRELLPFQPERTTQEEKPTPRHDRFPWNHSAMPKERARACPVRARASLRSSTKRPVRSARAAPGCWAIRAVQAAAPPILSQLPPGVLFPGRLQPAPCFARCYFVAN